METISEIEFLKNAMWKNPKDLSFRIKNVKCLKCRKMRKNGSIHSQCCIIKIVFMHKNLFFSLYRLPELKNHMKIVHFVQNERDKHARCTNHESHL